MKAEKLPEKCDALVVGTGGAGLTAALVIKDRKPSWSVWVVEKTDAVGGATAYSGGVCWIPGHKFKEDPAEDSQLARRYLKNAFPGIDDACLDGFIESAPEMVEFIMKKGVGMEPIPNYPDYYQEIEGSSFGRSMSPVIYKGPKRVKSLVRSVPWFFPPFTIKEVCEWGPHRLDRWNKTELAKRKIAGHLAGGRALVGALLGACFEAGVNLALESPVDALMIQNAQVEGVEIKGRKVLSPVVILACGGFSHNPELMKHIEAVRPILSSAPEACDTGGGYALALRAELKVGNPYCWWVPTMKLYAENEPKPGPDVWAYHPTLFDRAWPGGIMVNSIGKRFTNESACYNTVGSILAQQEDAHLDRVWLIWGDYYVKHYIRGVTSYLQPAKSYMHPSKSLEELAQKLDLPLNNLKETIEHWNEMVRTGKDMDFRRGESAYDRFMGDRFRDGHPNLGEVEPPFQAVRLYPGCLGTKMGPVTDEHGRVRYHDGRIVSGLYAVGNAAASFLGNIYPGAGGTLGPGLTYGFRAARHATSAS